MAELSGFWLRCHNAESNQPLAGAVALRMPTPSPRISARPISTAPSSSQRPPMCSALDSDSVNLVGFDHPGVEGTHCHQGANRFQ